MIMILDRGGDKDGTGRDAVIGGGDDSGDVSVIDDRTQAKLQQSMMDDNTSRGLEEREVIELATAAEACEDPTVKEIRDLLKDVSTNSAATLAQHLGARAIYHQAWHWGVSDHKPVIYMVEEVLARYRVTEKPHKYRILNRLVSYKDCFGRLGVFPFSYASFMRRKQIDTRGRELGLVGALCKG